MGGKAAVAGGLVMGLLAGAIVVGGVVVLAPDPTVPAARSTADPGGASPSAPVAAPSTPVTAPSAPVMASPSPGPSSSAAPSPGPSSSAVPSGEPGSSASASPPASAASDAYRAGRPALPMAVVMLGGAQIDRAGIGRGEIVLRARAAG